MYPWNCAVEFRKARNAETGCKLLMHFCGDILTFTKNARAEAPAFRHGECQCADYVSSMNSCENWEVADNER